MRWCDYGSEWIRILCVSSAYALEFPDWLELMENGQFRIVSLLTLGHHRYRLYLHVFPNSTPAGLQYHEKLS